MKYAITFAPEAKEGLAKLKRSEPASYKKAVKLLNEIADHPQYITHLRYVSKSRMCFIPETNWTLGVDSKKRGDANDQFSIAFFHLPTPPSS
jgi:toxin YoeB